jgi:hypothetical protein
VRVLLDTSTRMPSLMLRTAVKAGLGLGELPIHLAEHDRLVQIWLEPSRGAVYEIRLVTHQDLRHTARIAAMMKASSPRSKITQPTKNSHTRRSCGCCVSRYMPKRQIYATGPSDETKEGTHVVLCERPSLVAKTNGT